MKILHFSITLISLVCFASSAWAEPSVQWGERENSSVSSCELRWKSPQGSQKSASAGKVVTAQHTQSSGDIAPAIALVQHLQLNSSSQELNAPAQVPFPFDTPEPAKTKTNLSPRANNDTLKFPKSEPLSTPLKNPVVESDSARKPLPNIGKNNKEIECPNKATTKSIRDISYDIKPMPGTLPKECPLNTTTYSGRHFNRTCFQWTASNLCTKAAYFEDVQLERYGHSVCPVLEPVISGAKFFLTVPFLPYKMGLQTPDECVYTLGHYRVGNCAPHMLDPLPISVRAVLFEGAAIGAAVALIP